MNDGDDITPILTGEELSPLVRVMGETINAFHLPCGIEPRQPTLAGPDGGEKKWMVAFTVDFGCAKTTCAVPLDRIRALADGGEEATRELGSELVMVTMGSLANHLMRSHVPPNAWFGAEQNAKPRPSGLLTIAAGQAVDGADALRRIRALRNGF